MSPASTPPQLQQEGASGSAGWPWMARSMEFRATRVEALTTMVAAQWNNELYIVFGSRRLKALQDACSRGMRTMRVDCIVHDLCDNKLGELKAAFLCKFSLAMSTDQHGIVCPSPVAKSWSSSHWTRTISRKHPSSWGAWCNIKSASCACLR